MITGGASFTKGRFDPAQVLTLIETERVERWGAVPTMAIRLLEHPDFDAHDLSSLRSFPLGGAPVPRSLLERMARRLPQLQPGRGVVNTWGMTEGGGFFTLAASSDLQRFPKTVGRPLPTVEIAIADPDDDGCGEIIVRSPPSCWGYIGTVSEATDSDGWLRTGDVGHINDEGYVFIDGRSKDMVIRGGRTSPARMSKRLCCVIPTWWRPPQSVCRTRNSARNSPPSSFTARASPAPTAKDLARHMAGEVAYFEIPTRWKIRTTPLPTVGTEKVDKKNLALEFQ